jgi:hypothetical protein
MKHKISPLSVCLSVCLSIAIKRDISLQCEHIKSPQALDVTWNVLKDR